MFRFFHICNHQRKRRIHTPVTREIIVENQGGQVDIVAEGIKIAKVLEIRALDFHNRVSLKPFYYDEDKDDLSYDDTDETDGHYDEGTYYVNYGEYMVEGFAYPIPDSFYNEFMHNRLKWNVEPPIRYLVKADIVYTDGINQTESLNDCDICQGKGWYVDIMDANEMFSEATGLDAIVQVFVKDLLTDLYSSVLKLEYGHNLKQVLSSSNTDDEQLFDNIRLIISEVEDNFMRRQSEKLLSLEDDSILVSVRVQKLERHPRDLRKIVMELALETRSALESFRLLL